MDHRNDNDYNRFEKPASETPKARISIQSVVAPVVSALLVAIIISFKEWAKGSPWLTGLLVLLLVLLNFYPKIRRHILEWQKRRSVRREQAAFVRQWQAKFEELRLLEKLKEFENPKAALSIIHIVESPGSYEGISNQSFNPVYLSKWLYCFERRPRVPASDIRSFRSWCEEFTIVVDRFCHDYVMKAQERLESGPPLSKHGSANFEEFARKFNSYMDQAEEWSIGLEKRRCEVAASDDQFPRPPYSMYDLSYRVGSLRQNSVMEVSLSPQTRP